MHIIEHMHQILPFPPLIHPLNLKLISKIRDQLLNFPILLSDLPFNISGNFLEANKMILFHLNTSHFIILYQICQLNLFFASVNLHRKFVK
jgi:hypothetical protein